MTPVSVVVVMPTSLAHCKKRFHEDELSVVRESSIINTAEAPHVIMGCRYSSATLIVVDNLNGSDQNSVTSHASCGTSHNKAVSLSLNAIWCGRLQGIGVMSGEDAINYSLSGPMLRASGVPYDVRKDRPYLDYESYDFEIPVGEHGDSYDRFLCRFEEMRQSVRILEQALDRLPDGPINISDPRVSLPPKTAAMSDMEAMIFHFKQVMEGIQTPVGEAYMPIEGPKGELGYYFVSDGTAKPVRFRVRPPAFINLASLAKMAEGQLLSDLIAINASIDIVMGEVDR